MPVFTHALLLRNGAVLAAGPKQTVLTQAKLSDGFGAEVSLSTRRGRCHLEVLSTTRRVLYSSLPRPIAAPHGHPLFFQRAL